MIQAKRWKLAPFATVALFSMMLLLVRKGTKQSVGVDPMIPPPGTSDALRLEAYKLFNPTIAEFPVWMQEPLPPVYMSLENSVHFGLDTSIAADEWSNGLLPGRNGDGVFSLPIQGPKKTAHFTTSMFHQIRCLDILRSSLVAFRANGTKPVSLTKHCMNYLRQMVLCRSDVTLESGRHPVGPRTVVSDITHVCRDWSVVWDGVEKL